MPKADVRARRRTWLVWLGVMLAPALAVQQSPAQAHLTKLNAAQASAAAQKALASHDAKTEAAPDDSEGQDFVLRTPGAENLAFLPGELTLGDQPDFSVTRMQCGIFVVSATGHVQYLPTVGAHYKPYSDCEQMDALGLSADLGSRPRLIAFFLLRALGANHYDTPFVLTWNKGTSQYQVDYPTSFWLAAAPRRHRPRGAPLAGNAEVAAARALEMVLGE